MNKVDFTSRDAPRAYVSPKGSVVWERARLGAWLSEAAALCRGGALRPDSEDTTSTSSPDGTQPAPPHRTGHNQHLLTGREISATRSSSSRIKRMNRALARAETPGSADENSWRIKSSGSSWVRAGGLITGGPVSAGQVASRDCLGSTRAPAQRISVEMISLCETGTRNHQRSPGIYL